MKTAILQLLESSGDEMFESEIRERIDGKTTLKSKALRTLLQDGELRRTGGGRRNDPYRYSHSLVPIGGSEQQT
jgi:hypothetical protein